jgi:hypothetical protein
LQKKERKCLKWNLSLEAPLYYGRCYSILPVHLDALSIKVASNEADGEQISAFAAMRVFWGGTKLSYQEASPDRVSWEIRFRCAVTHFVGINMLDGAAMSRSAEAMATLRVCPLAAIAQISWRVPRSLLVGIRLCPIIIE